MLGHLLLGLPALVAQANRTIGVGLEPIHDLQGGPACSSNSGVAVQLSAGSKLSMCTARVAVTVDSGEKHSSELPSGWRSSGPWAKALAWSHTWSKLRV